MSVNDALFYNNRVAAMLESPGGIVKTSEWLTTYLRDKIREMSVARRALEPEVVDESQIDRNVNDDIPRMIFDIEQGATAISMNFRGKGGLSYFNNKKFSIMFSKIESDRLKKNRGEMATIRMPIQEILDRNTVYAMYNAEDIAFRNLLVAAVGVDPTNQDLTASGSAMVKTDLVSLLKVAPKAHGRPAKLIMTEDTFLDVAGWDSTQAGTDLVKEIVLNGYQYKTLLGVPVITTINAVTATDGVWDPKHIYTIPSKEFLGTFKLLADATHEVKKEADEYSFWSWEYPGMGIGNTKFVGRLKLT